MLNPAYIVYQRVLPTFVLRSTACTGKPTPASRRLRPSSPPGSCPIRRCARRPSTWPPTPPRGLSTHLDRMRSGRGFGGWQVEEKRGGLFIINEAVLVFVPHPRPPHRWIPFGSRGRLRVSVVIRPGKLEPSGHVHESEAGRSTHNRWFSKYSVRCKNKKQKNGKLYKRFCAVAPSLAERRRFLCWRGKKVELCAKRNAASFFFMHCWGLRSRSWRLKMLHFDCHLYDPASFGLTVN